jgi:shikimate kinase
MGSGKTTIGRMLAEELGWSFADLDADIEAAEGLSIGEIFESRGEQEFRRIEQDAVRKRLREIECGRPMVLALGGGAFTDDVNRRMLEASGVSIWLDCSFPRVCARIEGTSHRPLARDAQKFQKLYEERREVYEKAEHRVLIDSDDPTEHVAAIMRLGIL